MQLSKLINLQVRISLPIIFFGILSCLLSYLGWRSASFSLMLIFMGVDILFLIICIAFISFSFKPVNEMLKKAGGHTAAKVVEIMNREMTGRHDSDSYKDNLYESSQIFLNSSEEIMISSQQMFASSKQIADSVAELASGATEQALATEKGNSHIVEIVDGLTQIAEDMEQSEKLVGKALDLVAVVQSSVSMQDEKMKANAVISTNVSIAIVELAGKSKEIGSILKVIKSVADQTNLLALNAAIEAARAGEQGRGFAVVADEVRKLAEQSAVSVRRVSEIIRDVQAGIDAAVSFIRKSETTSEEHAEAIRKTNEAFVDICGTVGSVAEQVKSASYSAQILCESAREVSNIIGDIASVSQEFAAGTEEVSASTEEQEAAIELISSCTRELVEIARSIQTDSEKISA